MTATRPKHIQPRMLNAAEAAAYCGVSPNHFHAHVRVAPVLIGTKKLWDVRALDEYLDRLSGAEYTMTGDDWLAKVLP